MNKNHSLIQIGNSIIGQNEENVENLLITC